MFLSSISMFLSSVSVFFMLFPMLALMILLLSFTKISSLVQKSKMVKFKKIIREYFVKGKVEINEESTEYIGIASFEDILELSKREY